MRTHFQGPNIIKVLKYFVVFFLFPLNLIYGNNSSLGDSLYYEYWQRFNWTMWKNDPYIFRTYVDIKSGNIGHRGLRSILISEQFAYKATSNVTLELHYTFIRSRPIDFNYWIWQHRLEFEANRVFYFGKIQLDTRNRLEIRWTQDNPKAQYRLRQRTMLIFPIENRGSLKSYSIRNELFYDVSTNTFDQNRFSPLTVTFGLSNKTDLDVFFLIRFFINDKLWHKSLVFGTQLNF